MSCVTIIDDLIATAVADVDLLRTMDAQGDTFSTARSVEFVFTTETESQARAVAGFLAENQYAVTRWESSQEGYFVEAAVFMPIEQNLLSSVSGFMQCVAKLFAVHYDGWGAIVQRQEKSPGP
jgi:hypothetical protein